VIVVVLSVTPERLRGVLTRWLLEVSTGVYVGRVTARVREHIWDRIVDDVAQGRALMVWSRRGEQGLGIRVHNHSWDVVDSDGLTLMRRPLKSQRHQAGGGAGPAQVLGIDEIVEETGDVAASTKRRQQSIVGRRRRYLNAVERRHQSGSAAT